MTGLLAAVGPNDYALGIVRRVLGGPGEALDTAWIQDVERLVADRQVALDEVFGTVIDELTRQLRADRGTLYLVDRVRGELVSRAAHLPEIHEIRLKIGEGIAGEVAQTGLAVRVPQPNEEPRFAGRIDRLTGYRTRSLLAAPVKDRHGNTVAVVQILNRRGRPFDDDDAETLAALTAQVAQLLDATSLRSQLDPGAQSPLAFRFNQIVGESAAMEAVYGRVERAAATAATVLIRGESGVGKELIARAVHHNSPRRAGPFVKVDCAALPAHLVENELFGHERGAFTSADRSTMGQVRAAEGGTLFLDEIGELPSSVQGKLLRLLQDRVYLKVGGTAPQTADVRFVSATHNDLEDAVAQGSFRQDLYYRLRVIEIRLPALRERGHLDLDRLIDHFVYELSRRHSRPGLRLGHEARALLHGWQWPGNVRALQNVIESAVVLSPGPVIEASALSFSERRDARAPSEPAPSLTGGTPEPAAGPSTETAFSTPLLTLAEVETAYIRHMLAVHGGNRSATARALGIGRNTLGRKLGEDG